ncbi:hypothetical protein R6Z07F_009280 [Ovis aries]
MAPASGESTWPRSHGSCLPAPPPQRSPSTSESKEQSRRNQSPETRERQQARRTGQLAPPNVKTRLLYARPIPTPPLHLPCHLDVPPPISSLAQPASPTTDRHQAQGKGPPTLCAFSAGALRAPGATFNSGLSSCVASGHRAERAGKVSATP